MKRLIFFMAAIVSLISARAEEPIIDVTTTLGSFRVMLYDDTPLHRDNFLKLVDEGYYNGVTFHRVIKDFMVQGGDPNSKDSTNTLPLGAGGPSYRIPAEINYPKHFHKYGALAAARDNNPERSSSGSQFYIVTGKKYPKEMIADRVLQSARQSYFDELIKPMVDSLRVLYREGGQEAIRETMERLEKEATEAVKEAPIEILETYSTVGGTPHLDGQYTVFGEVLSGMDVVEKIQNVETGANDRPVEDVRILSMKVERRGSGASPVVKEPESSSKGASGKSAKKSGTKKSGKGSKK